MPIEEMPAIKQAKKTRANKTYKKKLTKRQLKNRKRKLLTLLIAVAVGIMVISAYGQCTQRYLDNILATPEISYKIVTPAEAKEIEIVDVSTGVIREVTAYNSVESQTDSTPCIAADGTDICKRYQAGELICAANFVPLGTKIYVDHYGLCTVADRMNKRYPNRVDVFFDKDIDRAVRFGLQRLMVKQ